MPLAALASTPWWNSDWQFRKAISVKLPSTTSGSGVPGAFVVPVRLHAGNFEYLQDLQPNGADLRFVGSDGTPLKHQIELLDPVAGLAIVWVRVPVQTDAIQQVIWMYYGNAHAPAPADAGIYDADQTVVLHFAEAQGETPRDATANHFDTAGTATAGTIHLGVPGVIGNGVVLDGHGYLRIAARPALAITTNGGFTFAAWVKPEGESPSGTLYTQSAGESQLRIGIANTKLYAEIRDQKRTTRVEATIPITSGQWHHVAASIASDVTLYVDGASAGLGPSNGLPQIAGDLFIGGEAGNDRGIGITGAMDEIEISRTARSSWWVQATVLAQNPQGTLLVYGADESKGSAGKFAAYMAMMRGLLSQVSLDGLVVITITALMGLASFQVLISKAGWLRRVEAEDAAFRKEFRERFRRDMAAALSNASPPAAADDARAKDFPVSGLSSMYHAALKSLETVLASSTTTQSGPRCAEAGMLQLGTEAFEALRSALDAALVEAANRLNARLVVMTVAIAGAPFLGLLGTVVGVMITFASIAAAGDVNVNTIAPGVAAAMTATVVGLLVAIPSLFGYNWLATRVARRTSDMEVFADEFVSNLGLFVLQMRNQPAWAGSPHRLEETSNAA